MLREWLCAVLCSNTPGNAAPLLCDPWPPQPADRYTAAIPVNPAVNSDSAC
jgi:hypothetical protein